MVTLQQGHLLQVVFFVKIETVDSIRQSAIFDLFGLTRPHLAISFWLPPYHPPTKNALDTICMLQVHHTCLTTNVAVVFGYASASGTVSDSTCCAIHSSNEESGMG